jgi:DNA-binding transcriptional regulator GbsR (MarR family)
VTRHPGPDQPSYLGGRDRERVLSFIERFASVQIESGIPRMPARVFAALLATDAARLSAAELADLLDASPAAISGGVKYLTMVGLVDREGERGSRRLFYRVPENVWADLMRIRDRLMERWVTVLREGRELLGADTPAGARMAGSVNYFEFVNGELHDAALRWQEYQASRR